MTSSAEHAAPPLTPAIDPLPPGIAVQPVLLAYADAPDIAWLGEEPGVDNFMKIMARKAACRRPATSPVRRTRIFIACR